MYTPNGPTPQCAVTPAAPQPGDDPHNPKARARATRAAAARNASGRRRMIDPTTSDRDYTAAEVEFMQAIHAYERSSGRMFPTWSEVLEVVRGLGYGKAVGSTRVDPTHADVVGWDKDQAPAFL